MSATTIAGTGDEEGNPYVGWLASLFIIVLVLAIGAGLWFHYHGL